MTQPPRPESALPLTAQTALIGFVLAVIFLSYPVIDIWAASLFKWGDGFIMGGTALGRFFKNFINGLTNFLIYFVLGGLVLSALFHKSGPLFGIGRRGFTFLFASIALGPGIFVNAILKELWGRARPQDVMELGGERLFTPPFIITDQCGSNCSFVSGDVAIAFSSVAFALLLSGELRQKALKWAIFFGLFIGMTRMAQGKHFLSDVFFAGIFTIVITGLCHAVIMERRWGVEERLKSWIGRGRA